jgi:hypothetical protein
MRMSVQAILTVLAAGVFFAAVYMAYICMYLGPTSSLRDWGATRWWLLLLIGPAGFKEAIGAGGMAMLLYQRPALAPVPAARGRRSRLGKSANRLPLGDDGEACLWPDSD